MHIPKAKLKLYWQVFFVNYKNTHCGVPNKLELT